MSSALNLLDKIKVFLGVKGLWKLFPSHRMKCLLQFEATEDDSAWQLLWACNQLKNSEQKAELFSQVLEEAHHAELFRTYIRQYSATPLHRISLERKPLYLKADEMWKYFPYCIVGETAASQRFERIAANLDQKTKANKDLLHLFKRILADEVGHIHRAEQLAMELQLPPLVLKNEIRQIKFNRFKEQWLRSGKKLVAPLATVLLWILYFAFFTPFVAFAKFKNQEPTCVP